MASTLSARSASTWQRGRRPSGNHRNLARPAHHRHGRQPHPGKPVPVGTFQALVEPNSTTDQTEENASPQTIEYTIRIRGSQPTGIQATDLIKVRGRLLPVKGKPQVWDNLHGRHVGDVITVGEREG